MKKEGAAAEAAVEVVEDVKTPEQIAAEEAEADKAFESGVAITRKTEHVVEDEPKVTKGKPDTTITDAGADDAEATAKAAADAEAARLADEKAKTDEAAKVAAAAAADPWKDVPAVVRDRFKALEDIPNQISKLAGHIGGFKRSLDTITSTAKVAADKRDVAAPSKLEVEEALSDPAKWTQLQEDFPEWMGPVAAELTRLRKDMAAVAKTAQGAADKPAAEPAAAVEPVAPVDTAAIVAEAEERAYVRLKHPDWKAICATPEFNRDWLPKQSEEIKALAGSDVADDAIKLFDTYKADRQKLADAAAAKLKQEQRLRGAVQIEGSGETPAVGISDDDAFNRGVKRVLKGAK